MKTFTVKISEVPRPASAGAPPAKAKEAKEMKIVAQNVDVAMKRAKDMLTKRGSVIRSCSPAPNNTILLRLEPR